MLIVVEYGAKDARGQVRNLFISDDPVSGYAASVLPGLQAAYRATDPEAFRSAVASLAIRVDLLSDRLSALLKLVYRL